MTRAFLEYAFIFSPDETWQHLFQFEQDLGKLFDDLGFQAEILETVGEQSGRRVIVITKKPVIGEPVAEANKVDTSKKRLKAMKMDRKGGKFANKSK